MRGQCFCNVSSYIDLICGYLVIVPLRVLEFVKLRLVVQCLCHFYVLKLYLYVGEQRAWTHCKDN